MVARSEAAICPVRDYAEKVVAGDVVAGRYVRFACERHLRDLAEGHKRGLVFDETASQRSLDFFSFLRLPVADELDGKAFDLEPFQKFIIGSLFGWKGPDGFRRFRTAYIEIGKGNGKTPMAAGVGLKGLIDDDEAAAEVYSAATKREQANILFRDARMMVEASPELRSLLTINAGNIAYEDKSSFFRPVSSEKRGLDGPRPHVALCDEVHEHPDAVVIDKIRAGTKARRQALIFEITNSGYDRTTVCWQHHDFSMAVLEGRVENDSWFAFVCGLDPCKRHLKEGNWQPVDGCEKCDNWQDEKVWEKANPGIDSILPRKYLREQVAEAREILPKQNIVKRLNFCLWTEAVAHAIPMDAWDACAGALDTEKLVGRECFGGLDIGATSDFTSFVLVFPHDDAETIEVSIDPSDQAEGTTSIVRRSFTVLPFFWMPDRPVKRDGRMETVIAAWKTQGLIKTTPDDHVDYDMVLADILTICRRYKVLGINVDYGFQGAQITVNLMKHYGEMVQAFRQGIVSYNAPFREMLELVKANRLHHDGNPVLRWMASNTAAETRGGLIKPSKDKSTEKIDGIAATVMALSRAIESPPPKVSVYETRRVLQLGYDNSVHGGMLPIVDKPAAREYRWREL